MKTTMKETKINSSKLNLILTAAGSSTRMGSGIKKEYMNLGKGTVLSESTRAFFYTDTFSRIIITVPAGGEKDACNALKKDAELWKDLSSSSTELIFTEGSSTRQSSIYNALKVLKEKISETNNNDEVVLIHDAARPFVSSQIIKDIITSSIQYGAAVPVIPPVDTQKELNPDGTINKHLIRSTLGAVQTPQGFDFNKLFFCHTKASAIQKEYTDDSEIWDAFPELTENLKVHTIKGSSENLKITYKQDIETKSMTRIGIGTDLHKLVEGRKFYLGGIEIPAEKGEEAHSDGDVLLHAITDAVLGAAGLGDIGSYFPPDDQKWKDADSKELLKKCWNDVKEKGYRLGNLDCVLEFESPKFLPWRQKVIESIAQVLDVEPEKVFVKAKTNEKMDSIGQRLAIKAYCVCLLEK